MCSPIFIYHWTYFVFFGIFYASSNAAGIALYPFPFRANGACGIVPPTRMNPSVSSADENKSRRSFKLTQVNKISLECNLFTIGCLCQKKG